MDGRDEIPEDGGSGQGDENQKDSQHREKSQSNRLFSPQSEEKSEIKGESERKRKKDEETSPPLSQAQEDKADDKTGKEKGKIGDPLDFFDFLHTRIG